MMDWFGLDWNGMERNGLGWGGVGWGRGGVGVGWGEIERHRMNCMERNEVIKVINYVGITRSNF